MRAMIFAAGLGTRLQPLTLSKPKALVEVAGKTLLERAIVRLIEAGYTELVINVHHFGDQIIRFLEAKNNFGVTIHIADEREHLLDTGGGIAAAAPFLDKGEPFLVYNVDVLTDINLKQLMDYHLAKGGLATLAVRSRTTARYLAFDKQMQLAGWTNVKTGEKIEARDMDQSTLWAFSGIQIIDPAIFSLISENGAFPIIPLYLRLATNHPIYGYPDSSSIWMDLGKPDQLEAAEKMILSTQG